MQLQHTMIRDAMAEALASIAIIEAHAGQLAECEALVERLNEVAPRLDGKALANVNVGENSLTTRVLIIAARESELTAALHAADLRAANTEYGYPCANSMRIHLAGGIRTVIDIIIAVDEFDAEAQPPADMPLAA